MQSTRVVARWNLVLTRELKLWKSLVKQQKRHVGLQQQRCQKPPEPTAEVPKRFPTGQLAAGAALLSAGGLYYAYKSGVFGSKESVKTVIVEGVIEEEPVKADVPTLPKLELPEHVTYLLVGAGTASFAAFRSIRSIDPKARVLVIGDEDYYPYMRPPLSKELWFNEDPNATKNLKFKQWNGKERSVFFEHEDFYCPVKDLAVSENGCVSVVTGRKVVRIDPEKKRAYLNDGNEIAYDKCLIATGGRPKSLPALENAPEKLKKKVSLFRNIKDFQEISGLLNKVSSIAIIGGGFLGSELACALGKTGSKRGVEIYQIFPESGNMAKVLPAYLSSWATEKIAAEGVKVIPNASVQEITPAQSKVSLKLSNGKEVTADHILVAIGLDPNTELAEISGLEVDTKHGGIVVNSEMEARSNIWAAGDVACFFDSKFGRRRVEHHDHAVISGRLAGDNMTGSGKPYLHQSMFWSDLGTDISYEAIGIVDSHLPTVAVFAKPSAKDPAVDEDASKDSEQSSEVATATPKQTSTQTEPGNEYGRGVIFYLRENVIVGILLWNIFNRMALARRILKEDRSYDDLNEVAKLFHLHEPE